MSETAERPLLVFDTSAVFNFGHRGRAADLLDRFAATHRLAITSAVRREIADPFHASFYATFLSRFEDVNPSAGAAPPAIPLDAGETSVLLACQEHSAGGARPVLDETPAWREALRLGLEPWDSLALLHEALRLRWLSDDSCLEIAGRMISARAYLPRIGANDTFLEYFRASRTRRQSRPN